MLYYADNASEIDGEETRRRILETLRSAAAAYRCAPSPRRALLRIHPELVSSAIELGEMSQAFSDLASATFDDVSPETDRMYAAAALLGRCVSRSWRLLRRPSADGDMGLHELMLMAHDAVFRATAIMAGGTYISRVPEGYAFYSLYPEMYLASAVRAVKEMGDRHRYVVIGIRSIGASLAPLVAGELQEMGLATWVETLRPRGHPFNRYVELGERLRARLEAEAADGAGFLVVDEGPGLTCSSFLSVCAALDRIGVGEDRIAILSAWMGKPSIYASDEGRARWSRLRVFHTEAGAAFNGWRRLLPFIQEAMGRTQPDGGNPPEAHREPAIRELSYGRWREILYPSPDRWPVVHRSTERVKLLVDLPAGPLLGKFAGLGSFGTKKLERARRLAESGFSPPVSGLAYGFLFHPFFAEARPLAREELNPDLVARMAQYYAFIGSEFRRPAAPRFARLAEMITINAREALSADASGFVASWQPRREAIDRLPLAQLDGRPEPHEWLQVAAEGRARYIKTDHWDHFLDHTLVGEQSPAWDLAGAIEEWRMTGEHEAQFLQDWEGAGGKGEILHHLGFFRTAYMAFRVAALHYAVHSTDEVDIRRSLQHEESHYRQRLSEMLGGHDPVGPAAHHQHP